MTEPKLGLGLVVVDNFRLLLDRFFTARSGETPQAYLKGGVFLEVHPRGGERVRLNVGNSILEANTNDAVYKLTRWGIVAKRFIASQFNN